MSYTIRGKTVGYDNIAVASATGKERTISGSTGQAEVYPGGLGDTTITAGGAIGYSNIAAGATASDVDDENIGVLAVAPQAELLNSSNIAGMVS